MMSNDMVSTRILVYEMIWYDMRSLNIWILLKININEKRLEISFKNIKHGTQVLGVPTLPLLQVICG